MNVQTNENNIVDPVEERHERCFFCNARFFFYGFAAGILIFLAIHLLGFEIEHSSCLQIYNFNSAVANGGYMARATIARSCAKSDHGPNVDFLDDYKFDPVSGCGWSAPVRFALPDDKTFENTDESESRVMLFFWRGRPFGVMVLAKDSWPQIHTVRTFGDLPLLRLQRQK